VRGQEIALILDAVDHLIELSGDMAGIASYMQVCIECLPSPARTD